MITLKGVSCSAIILMSFAVLGSLPASAQPKPGMSKTVFDNDKITVTDTMMKPGEGLPSAERNGLILYYLSGGKAERTFADGTKDTVTRKTGQSLVNAEKRAYSVENTGTTTLHVISVKLK